MHIKKGNSMFTPYNQTRAKYFALIIITVAFACLLLNRPSIAKLAANTIDPTIILDDRGRHLLLTGPITCTGGERTDLRVIVTQRSTGAVAEGTFTFTCSGSGQQWEVQAQTKGKASFQTGAATVVALAVTYDARGEATDAHQWLVNGTILQ
jgi:hypothetical protein